MNSNNSIRLKPIVYWLLWASWTILICFLMLSPSRGTAVRDISMLFGGTELTDAIGHIFLIFIDTTLFYNALCSIMSENRAFRYAIVVTLLFGLFVETAQVWIPSRGASIIDVLAAFIGVGLFAFVSTKTSRLRFP